MSDTLTTLDTGASSIELGETPIDALTIFDLRAVGYSRAREIRDSIRHAIDDMEQARNLDDVWRAVNALGRAAAALEEFETLTGTG